MITLEEIFGEDICLDEVLGEIRHDFFDGVTNVKDELKYNEGWYNYSSLTFDYEGKRYTIDYKEHTSDNICDLDYLMDTLVCLGEASEMENTVNMEELVRERVASQRLIDSLQKQIGEVSRERNRMNEKLGKLFTLTKDQAEYFSKLFFGANEDTESKNTVYKNLGEFFELIAEDKRG